MRTRDMMSWMCGALAGAAAMYLLDPDTGARRRKYLKHQAGEYLDDAGEMLGSGWETVSDKAKEVGGTLAGKAQDLGSRIVDQAKDLGSSWRDRAGRSASDVSDRASGWLSRGSKWLSSHEGQPSDLRDYGSDLLDRARSRVQKISRREERSPVVPVVLTAIGCCVLGAGIMYVIDPQRGRARRAWLMDKSRSTFRRTGRSMYRTGKHLANRAYGAAHEVGSMWHGGSASTGPLDDRVRSELGRAVSHPRLIETLCDDNGTVTLTGCVLEQEAAPLITRLESVPGVNLVINRLESVASREDLDRRAGSRTQGVSQM